LIEIYADKNSIYKSQITAPKIGCIT